MTVRNHDRHDLTESPPTGTPRPFSSARARPPAIRLAATVSARLLHCRLTSERARVMAAVAPPDASGLSQFGLASGVPPQWSVSNSRSREWSVSCCSRVPVLMVWCFAAALHAVSPHPHPHRQAAAAAGAEAAAANKTMSAEVQSRAHRARCARRAHRARCARRAWCMT